MVGWHHRLNGHESEQTLGVGEGQGSLACCSPWGRKESDTTEWLNWTDLSISVYLSTVLGFSCGSASRVCLQCRTDGFDPWVGKIPWRRVRQPTPVFLPGKSLGQRNLMGYSPWAGESWTRLRDKITTIYLSFILSSFLSFFLFFFSSDLLLYPEVMMFPTVSFKFFKLHLSHLSL